MRDVLILVLLVTLTAASTLAASVEREELDELDYLDIAKRAMVEVEAEDEREERLEMGGCYWAGSSPFCQAKCTESFTTVRADKRGDGHRCITGMKYYCCPSVITALSG